MEKRFILEIGNIKGNLKKLWNCAKEEGFDVNRCLYTIHEIDKSLQVITQLFRNYIVKGMIEVKPDQYYIWDRISRVFGGKGINEFIDEHLSSFESNLTPTGLSSLIECLENSQSYEEKYLRSTIIDFCKELEKNILFLEQGFQQKSGLLLLAEFSSLFQAYSPNWIVATVYLTAMEISIKKELKKRGKELKGAFKENFKLLLTCMKEVNITELEKALPSVFWDIRNKVIHEGYSPSDEELEIIKEYVGKLLGRFKV